jgi:hypothetical protein
MRIVVINEKQLISVGRILSSRQLLGISNPRIEVITPTPSATAQLQFSVNFLINKLCFLFHSNAKWGSNWPWKLTTIKIQSENLERAWAHRVQLPSAIYLITAPIAATTLPLTRMNIQTYRKRNAFGCSPYLTRDLLILRLCVWIPLKTTSRIWLRIQHTKRKMWTFDFRYSVTLQALVPPFTYEQLSRYCCKLVVIKEQFFNSTCTSCTYRSNKSFKKNMFYLR